MMKSRWSCAVSWGLFLFVLTALPVSMAYADAAGVSPVDLSSIENNHPSKANLDKVFAEASAEFGVPAELLKAVAYLESAWVNIGPTCDAGYGIMHLVKNEYCSTLEEAAALLGVSEETLMTDAVANIRGGAALIAKYAKETVGSPKTLEDYWDALKKFSGLISEELQENQAQEYYRVLNDGVDIENGLGMTIKLAGVAVDVSDKAPARKQIQSTDYAPAYWIPADPSNYSTRSTGIDRWVNHWIAVGTVAGAISWFQNPASNVSAHFCIRSWDGRLTQMVRFYLKAWHCSYWNSRSIGIEHEATVANPNLWYDPDMLRESAKACAYVCNRYGFPKTRTYIVGHKEVPYASTSCPGNLPWTTYMNLVQGGTSPTSTPTTPLYAAHYHNQSYSSSMTGAGTAICWVEYVNDGRATWTHAYTRLGTTEPRDRSSVFYLAGNWLGANRPTEVDQPSVTKGQVGRFTFIMKAPDVSTTTTYTEHWGLLQEGVTWFGPADSAVWFRITVTPSGPTKTPTNTFTKTNTPTVTPTPFLPSQVIIDNAGSGWSDDGSPWSIGSSAPDKYGADYAYTSTNYGARTSTWNHYINGAGSYKVYAWWPAGTNRSNNTPYVIHRSGGDSTVWVNQELSGGTWNLLGTFTFDSLLSVSVSTDGAETGDGQMVMADAVMFTLSGGQQTPTNTSAGPTNTPTNTPTKTATYTHTNTPTITPTNTPTSTATSFISDEDTINTTKDTHVRDYNDTYKARNYGIYNRLLIGYYSGWGFGHQRGFVQFDLSSLPDDIEITDAKISLYQDTVPSHASSNQSHAVHVYRVTSSWSEGTQNGAAGSVCWNDQPSINTTSLASLTINGVASGTWKDFSGANLTSIVNGWVQGTYTNYGVCIRNSTADENDDGAHKFYSDDQGTNPPKIWVQYNVAATATASDTPTDAGTDTPTWTATHTFTSTPTPVNIIIDNDDGDYTDSGSDTAWATGSAAGDKYGDDYRYNACGTGIDCATWTVSIPVADDYDVYVWYPQGSNRASNAPFTIMYDGGQTTIYVNQKFDGGAWRKLGNFYFDVDDYTIGLSDDAEEGQLVMADAVKFARTYPTPTPTNTPVTTPEGRVVWIDVWNMDSETEIQTAINKAVAYNMNAIACQVRYRGDALYEPNRTDGTYPNSEPRSEKLAGQSPSFDPLQTAITLGHNAGLQVHAWVTTYPAWASTTAPVDPDHVFNTHSDWITYDDDDNIMEVTDAEGAYLDPGILDVQTYLANVFKDIIVNYDIDGIHLDYIRYPTTSYDRTLDWGFNSAATDRYAEELNKAASPTDSDWQDWKRTQVTSLVHELWDFVLANAAEVSLCCDVIGNRSTAEGWNFQNWSSWGSTPIVDALYPMCYSETTSTVTTQASDAFSNVSSANVFIGLKAYDNASYPASSLVEKVNDIRALGGFDEGSDGFAFFDNTGLQENSDAFYNALVSGPISSWKAMPSNPVRPTPTYTPTDPPTATPTETPTDTPTRTPTDTPTNTPTNSPTFTPSNTPSNTPTDTPTTLPTDTPTNTPSSTPTGIIEVVIDSTKDTHIRDYSDTYKARNYGIYNRLLIGYYNGWGFYHQRALVQFDVSSIPANASVREAEISLYQDAGSSHANSNQSHAVHVYRITSSWSEGTQNGATGSVCWNDQPSKNTTSLASLTIAGVASGTWRSFTAANLEDVVQGWIDGTYTNYGVMIMNSVSNENDDGAHKFYSDDMETGKPKIRIEYEILPTPTPSDTPTNTPTNSPTPTATSYTTEETMITGSKDTHIRDYNADYLARNYGIYNRLLIGYYNGWGFSHQRSFAQFDLSSIPSNATVVECNVSLYQDVGASHDSSNQSHTVHAYRVTSSWSEGTCNGTAGSVCWNDQPTINTTSLASLTITGVASGTARTWSGTNLTNVVQDWIDGSATNYGMCFRNSTADENDDGAHKFYSSEQGTSPPVIYVKYNIPVQ